MATRWTSALALGALLLACDDPAPAARSSSGPGAPAPAPAFSGALTSERILSAGGLVRPLDPWSGALSKLEAHLGKPTRVAGGFYEWAVLDGESCTLLQIERVDDGRYLPDGSREVVVGLAFEPLRAQPRTDAAAYKTCVAITRGEGPPAGASSPSPQKPAGPEGGAPSIAELNRDASKWAWKPVKVKGILKGVTTATMKSGDTTVERRTATLVASLDKGAPELTCVLPSAAPSPALPSLSPVVAAGVVAIDEGGGPPSLESCTVAAPP